MSNPRLSGRRLQALRAQVWARSPDKRCRLCGDPVQLGYHQNHALAYQIAHHTPLAHGGTDDLTNLAVVHRICNLRKGHGWRPTDSRIW